MKIDVLYCVEKRDVNNLFLKSINLCCKNFILLNDIYIVTNDVNGVNQLISGENFHCKIKIIDERTILKDGQIITGWYRQQMIKLLSYKICKTKYICCLGADAFILSSVDYNDLFYDEKPILYYNRYDFSPNHLEYERKRIENIAILFDITPKLTYMLGDFIMELMIFEDDNLKELELYVQKKYGSISNLLSKLSSTNFHEKAHFGEWSLYAMFLLDIIHKNVLVKNAKSEFMLQIHSRNDIALYKANAKVIHIVNKFFSEQEVDSLLRKGK
jgi:hypothetical protein